MPGKFIATAAAAVALLSATFASARAEPVKNIVLVHGAFADGSGWRRVADILGKDGYTVSVVQEPLTSLADDVAATKRVPGSHAVYISKPNEVARLIERAAKASAG